MRPFTNTSGGNKTRSQSTTWKLKFNKYVILLLTTLYKTFPYSFNNERQQKCKAKATVEVKSRDKTQHFTDSGVRSRIANL